MAVESQSRRGAVDKTSFRHRDGHLVTAYLQADGTWDVWVNDGPPKQHYLGITDDQLRGAVLSGQLKGGD